MTAKLPEPDLNYLQRVLLEMLAIPNHLRNFPF